MACEDPGPAMCKPRGSHDVPALSSSSKHAMPARSPIHLLIGDAFYFCRAFCLLQSLSIGIQSA